jgi:hypothetical protein
MNNKRYKDQAEYHRNYENYKNYIIEKERKEKERKEKERKEKRKERNKNKNIMSDGDKNIP